jgi:hypothetical protein
LPGEVTALRSATMPDLTFSSWFYPNESRNCFEFWAVQEGRPIWCAVTREALHVRFGLDLSQAIRPQLAQKRGEIMGCVQSALHDAPWATTLTIHRDHIEIDVECHNIGIG